MSFRLSKGNQRMAGLLEEEGNKLKWWYFSSFRENREGGKSISGRAGGKRAGLVPLPSSPNKEKRDTDQAVHPFAPQLWVGLPPVWLVTFARGKGGGLEIVRWLSLSE